MKNNKFEGGTLAQTFGIDNDITIKCYFTTVRREREAPSICTIGENFERRKVIEILLKLKHIYESEMGETRKRWNLHPCGQNVRPSFTMSNNETMFQIVRVVAVNASQTFHSGPVMTKKD